MSAAARSVQHVDVHSHFITEDYISAAKAAGIESPDGLPAWPQWSATEHLRVLERANIERAILSVSSPGVNFGDDVAAVQLAREMNAIAAEIADANPGRLTFFGSLPLPDVGASLAEIDRCFDELRADGIALMSNVHGVYLGDDRYKPIWQALDDRSAVVFIHPTGPPHADAVALGRPNSVVEFIFDEARTVVDMIFAGVLLDYPRIRFVITHSGGALPVIADRAGARYAPPKESDPSLREQLARLWFDCAGTPLPTALPTLRSVIGDTQLLFGTDYCFIRPDMVAVHERRLATADQADWPSLMRRNASRLLADAAHPVGDDEFG
jgi:predicted TIM-barrel fold metal-dependent hydrolase